MNYREESRRASRLIAGGLLMLVGVLFVLQNLGVLQAGQLGDYWPLFLVWIGLSKMIGPRRGHHFVWGAVILALGMLFQLDRLDVLSVRMEGVWPAFLVIAGVALIADSLIAKRASRAQFGAPSEAGRGGGS